MTIQVHPNIRYLIAQRGLAAGLGSSITIFSGPQPTAAQLLSSWASYSSSALLHYLGAVWTQPSSNTTTFVSLTTIPAAATAIMSGTGTWAILWASAVTQANLSNPTIPNTYFIVVPVSSLAGQGVIRFNPSALFTAGLSYTIADGTISVGSA